MEKKHYNIIGVMSGTSLDGVDLAHIEFHFINNKWTFEIFESQTVSYNQNWIDQLKSAVDFSETQLEKLNQDYTALLANIISTFIEKHTIDTT